MRDINARLIDRPNPRWILASRSSTNQRTLILAESGDDLLMPQIAGKRKAFYVEIKLLDRKGKGLTNRAFLSGREGNAPLP